MNVFRSWFGRTQERPSPSLANEPAKPSEGDGIDIYATDSVRRRAENIVWMMGFRGAVGDRVLNVMDLLEAYERLDRKQAVLDIDGLTDAVLRSNPLHAEAESGEPTGDRRCQQCASPNPTWFAPNPIWNLVMGGPKATGDPGGVLCPSCFIARAEESGVSPAAWVLAPEAESGREPAGGGK